MTPAHIGDSVALEALDMVVGAVWSDYHRAHHGGTEVEPRFLLEVHRHAGSALADRVFLILDLAISQGEVETQEQVAEIEHQACTRLLTRLDLAMRETSLVRPDWITDGAAELCRAFRARIDALFAAPRGGSA